MEHFRGLELRQPQRKIPFLFSQARAQKGFQARALDFVRERTELEMGPNISSSRVCLHL